MLIRFSIFLCIVASCAGVSQAALMVTNGDFQTDVLGNGGSVTDVSGWFESDTVGGEIAERFDARYGDYIEPNSENNLGRLDATTDYLYQSLGTIEAGGELVSVSFTALERNFGGGNTNDRSFGTLQMDFYAGSFPGAAEATDIAGQGLTLVGTYLFYGPAIDPVPLGGTLVPFTTALADDAEFIAVDTVASPLDLSGVAPGTEIWVRISQPIEDTVSQGQTGAQFDNLVVSTAPIPEPGSMMLVGAGILLVVRRRCERG